VTEPFKKRLAQRKATTQTIATFRTRSEQDDVELQTTTTEAKKENTLEELMALLKGREQKFQEAFRELQETHELIVKRISN
jgi:hypothetical protein